MCVCVYIYRTEPASSVLYLCCRCRNVYVYMATEESPETDLYVYMLPICLVQTAPENSVRTRYWTLADQCHPEDGNVWLEFCFSGQFGIGDNTKSNNFIFIPYFTSYLSSVPSPISSLSLLLIFIFLPILFFYLISIPLLLIIFHSLLNLPLQFLTLSLHFVPLLHFFLLRRLPWIIPPPSFSFPTPLF
jgi:hypothetical protein